MNEFLAADATGQAELIRTGQVSPREAVQAAADRIAETNPAVNAVIHEWVDRAVDEATRNAPGDGPFAGVPLLLKDSLCHTAGDPHTEGSQALKSIGWREPADCDLAARFRTAGFRFIGKTNTPEFAGIGTTEPTAYGATRNPWDLSRSVGGSSGGSAAAVASHMVAAAHGTDASGSIRIPASMCGLVGLKPSRGRTPIGPDWSESMGPVPARYVQHVLTRSVRDAGGILDAIAGPGTGQFCDPPSYEQSFAAAMRQPPGRLRIAYYDEPVVGDVRVAEDPRRVALETARRLQELGHTVEPTQPPWFSEVPSNDDAYSARAAVSSAFSWMLEYWTKRTGHVFSADDFEPYTWAMIQDGRSMSATSLLNGMEWIKDVGLSVARWWATSGYDALLTPTTPLPPPQLGDAPYSDDNPSLLDDRTRTLVTFTYWCNISGDPAISLPLGQTADGLPIGAQLAAPYGHEARLLQVAAQLEQAAPWSHDVATDLAAAPADPLSPQR